MTEEEHSNSGSAITPKSYNFKRTVNSQRYVMTERVGAHGARQNEENTQIAFRSQIISHL